MSGQIKTSRRGFLAVGSALVIAGSNPIASSLAFCNDAAIKPDVKFSMMTDLHFADKPNAGSRYYKETPVKLRDVQPTIDEFQPQFLVELGDFVDAAATVQRELEYLKTINDQFATLPGDKHFVLGNHCVHTLTKEEFLRGVGQEKSYYSFDHGKFHFVVLDSCFRTDGEPYARQNFKWTDPNIPKSEKQWLVDDLAKTDKSTIVFAHQRLDVKPSYHVKNAADIRAVLEAPGKVLAVFQGHSHANDHQEIGGIHYCTLHAMIEGSGLANNGAANVELFADGSIKIAGIRKQKDYDWT